MRKVYKTLVADPPWKEVGGGGKGAQYQYELMRSQDIALAMMLSDAWRIGKDAHLYLWVTNTFLKDGLKLMEDLEFRYVTNIVWVKNSFGIGQYFRGQHEICLFGVRGSGYSVRTASRGIPSILHAKKGRHSQKPESFYEMVEQRSEGPYAELFARRGRPGWDSWGNEVNKS